MAKMLYVPVSSEALDRLRRQASIERRRPQDEAAILLERALGVHPPQVDSGHGAREDSCVAAHR